MRSAVVVGNRAVAPRKLKVSTLTDTTSSIPATTQSCDNLEAAALVQRATHRHCFSRSAPILGAAEQEVAIKREPIR